MSTELSLERCWILPSGDIMYLRNGYVCVEFKNNSTQTIQILEVVCSFQTEGGLPPYEGSIKPMIFVKPNSRSEPGAIQFVADLSLTLYTNSFTITVKYKPTESGEVVTQKLTPHRNYLIVHPLGPPERHFFVSHKDSEDTALAERLDYYLRKIGFSAYIAEKDRRPGVDLWDEKIFPAIDHSVAFITLWTEAAAREPSMMLRELEYAKRRNKKLVLLSEKDLSRPSSFPERIEFVRTSSQKMHEADLLDLVRWVEQTYRSGGY